MPGGQEGNAQNNAAITGCFAAWSGSGQPVADKRGSGRQTCGPRRHAAGVARDRMARDRMGRDRMGRDRMGRDRMGRDCKPRRVPEARRYGRNCVTAWAAIA
jgi:hypothetical protein